MDEHRAGSKAGMVAAIAAGLLFAVFLMILPRLGAGGEEGTVAADLAPGIAEPASNPGSPVAPADTTAATLAPTSSTTPTTTSASCCPNGAELVPNEGASPFVIPAPPGEDADLDLAVSVEAGGEEKESPMMFDGDDLTWTLRVTNAGEEYLWGVYAHLEGHGRMTCDHRRLDTGETALCTATTTGVAGERVGWLWATAWTTTSIIGTDVTLPIVVMP